VATDTKLAASAGEHHVCAELARRNWAPSLTRDGLPRTDILAVHTVSPVMIEVQVKTSRTVLGWMLGRGGTLASISEREWYVFVWLGDPRCWIVPRDHVAAATWISHKSWLTDPTAKPDTRHADIKDANVKVEAWERYEDRWDLLHEPATRAPVLLPMWMKDKSEDREIGLPDGHPWRAGLPPWT
jgi:hypothetical protein